MRDSGLVFKYVMVTTVVRLSFAVPSQDQFINIQMIETTQKKCCCSLLCGTLVALLNASAGEAPGCVDREIYVLTLIGPTR